MTSGYRWREGRELQYVAAETIENILDKNKSELIDMVASSYLSFYRGHAINPDTYSLKFASKPNSRINALPAYVGQSTNLAGLKWVASFPDNVEHNLQRASASIILNSFQTGYPLAILDGTQISSARTVASAALAARCLRPSKRTDQLVVYGAGVINRHLLQFMNDDGWTIGCIVVSDPDPASARHFKVFCEEYGYNCVEMSPSFSPQDADLISFATSALDPWYNLEIPDHQIILHMSLRDIVPRRLSTVRNIVDDVDHAVKANTSLHLLQQEMGQIDSIENFSNIITKPEMAKEAVVVSAFGMGMLDVAFGGYVMNKAEEQGSIREIDGFRSPQTRWQ